MGLANADFRKFIDEARTPAASGKHKLKKKKEEAPKKKQVEQDDEPKYRDRAEERRRGLQEVDEVPRYLTAEQSLYMGGSLERTHLVRGLDRLLLDRVKRGDAPLGIEGDTTSGAAAATAAPARPSSAVHSRVEPVPTSHTTVLGRAVAQTLLRPARGTPEELFQPRRMAFVYFANEGEDGPEDEEADEEWVPRPFPASRDVLRVPDTLLRPRAECPEPPDAMNVAADARIVQEVVGVMQAIQLQEGRRGKDRKKGSGREDTAAAASEAQATKEKHVLRLRMIANPQLAASDAAGAAAATAAPGASAKVSAAARGGGGGTAPPEPAGSEGSDLFDDVGHDYEVNTSALRNRRAAGNEGTYFEKGAEGEALPAVAQHGASMGNEAARGGSGALAGATGREPPHAPHAHAPYPGQSFQHDYQQHGYYMPDGSWVPYSVQDYTQWGYAGTGDGGAAWAAAAPQHVDKSAGGKGKGFAAKMGDRAVVRTAFTTEQRKAKEGKGGGLPGDDGDIYGTDALLGAGGLEDDDEDLRAMETRERALNRADFETDEQFQAYKASKEAAPKAAFQYGVKVQDGRRTHKDMDRKLDNDLRKIKNIKVTRGGESVELSHTFGAAFTDGSQGAEVAATPFRKKPRIQGM